jgi:hypothetical protein
MGRPANPAPCVLCGRAMPPGTRRSHGRCNTCTSPAERQQATAAASPPDGSYEMYSDPAYGAGWVCRRGGPWYRVAATPHGWAQRTASMPPTPDAVVVTGDRLTAWGRYVGVADGEAR